VEGIDLVVAPDMADSVGVQVSVRENADHIATDITAESITWIGRPKSSRQQQGGEDAVGEPGGGSDERITVPRTEERDSSVRLHKRAYLLWEQHGCPPAMQTNTRILSLDFDFFTTPSYVIGPTT
jgi:hypothetical protein